MDKQSTATSSSLDSFHVGNGFDIHSPASWANQNRNDMYRSVLDKNLKALDDLNVIETGSQSAAQSAIDQYIYVILIM
jgi:hypothetical protein